MSTTVVHGAIAVDADGSAPGSWLVLDRDRIAATGRGDGWRDHAMVTDRVLDVGGAIVTPGFIDLHCHGGGGASFEDSTEAMASALRAHRAHGTTRSVVSLVSAGLEETIARLHAIAGLAASDPLVLGAHLEGPYLAPARKGAHELAALRAPSLDEIDALWAASAGTLLQVTIAPELPGALEAIGAIAARGAVAAIGHTDATFDEARAAFDAGATLLTHAFNAMPGIEHRSPGPIPAAIADDRVLLELIADGRHVHPAVVSLAFASAPGRIVLVSDAMAAAAAPDGAYRLGALDVDVVDRAATVRGTPTLAGSTLTMDRALHVAVQECGVPLRAAIEAMTLAPARVIGRSHELGRLRPGFLADLVVLDHELRVQRVIAAGADVPPQQRVRPNDHPTPPATT